MRLAEGVCEEDRDGTVFERRSRPRNHLARDLGAWREDVLRFSVRALHQHAIAAFDLGHFRRIGRFEFEVTRVDVSATVALDEELRTAEHVARREEREFVIAFSPRLVECMRLPNDVAAFGCGKLRKCRLFRGRAAAETVRADHRIRD